MRRETVNFTTWEWVILFGLAAVAIAMTQVIGLNQKWEDVVVFTVVLFGVVLVTLRQLWKNPAFWRSLLPIFALHAIALTILAQVLPLGNSGFPKLPLIVGGMLEGILILAVVWKRAGGTTDGPRSQC